ncbi:predicted protein, partial [Nematostella vectensis]
MAEPNSENEALQLHNNLRAIHGSQPMRLNKEMSDAATDWAKKMASQHKLIHSPLQARLDEGENLLMACNRKGEFPVSNVVKSWYDEVCAPGYDFPQGRGQGGTGHFTQVVWNASVELGIGKATTTKNGTSCTFYVARYKPAGNH